ncbi:MAG: FadR/GntR family transcriptional regulator [Coriobacteriaceae bacterium]
MAQPKSGLPEQVSKQIIQLILNEGLKQGDRLPNETVLSEKLGVGRSSVREAMKLLRSRNIVSIRQGSGTYVSSNPGIAGDPLGFTFIEDKRRLARDLLEVRFMIEPQMAGMAAEKATADQVQNIKKLCDETEKLAAAGEDYSAADTAFHSAIAESCGNMVIPRLMGILKYSVPLFIDVTGKQLIAETIRTHRAIADSLAAHDSTAAHDAMYLHLVYNRNIIANETDQE